MSDHSRSSRHSSSRHSSSKHKKLRTARDSIYKLVGGGFAAGGNPLDLVPDDVPPPSQDCDAKTRAFASLA